MRPTSARWINVGQSFQVFCRYAPGIRDLDTFSEGFPGIGIFPIFSFTWKKWEFFAFYQVRPWSFLSFSGYWKNQLPVNTWKSPVEYLERTCKIPGNSVQRCDESGSNKVNSKAKSIRWRCNWKLSYISRLKFLWLWNFYGSHFDGFRGKKQ